MGRTFVLLTLFLLTGVPRAIADTSQLATDTLASREVKLATLDVGIDGSSITVSPNGQRVAFRTASKKKWSFVTTGQEDKTYDAIGASTFKPSRARLQYAVQREQLRAASEKQEREEPAAIVFSADGQRLAYVAQRGKTWLAVVDGQEGTTYQALGSRRVLGCSKFELN